LEGGRKRDMWCKPPVDIPGTSIRPPDKPGSKKCPDCGRRYKKEKLKKGKKKKVTKHCPFCNTRV
jgi:hypothetical protein